MLGKSKKRRRRKLKQERERESGADDAYSNEKIERCVAKIAETTGKEGWGSRAPARSVAFNAVGSHRLMNTINTAKST